MQSYHGRVWEFAMLFLLLAVLTAFLAPRFFRPGPRGAVAGGTLLVTGVSPRPPETGEQYVTIAGVINGPTVNDRKTLPGPFGMLSRRRPPGATACHIVPTRPASP